MSLSEAASTFIAENRGTEIEPEPPQFSPTRWPYTYAYDYIRECLPDSISRSDAARKTKAWCDARAMSEDERVSMLEVFAHRYIRRHGIVI